MGVTHVSLSLRLIIVGLYQLTYTSATPTSRASPTRTSDHRWPWMLTNWPVSANSPLVAHRPGSDGVGPAQ